MAVMAFPLDEVDKNQVECLSLSLEIDAESLGVGMSLGKVYIAFKLRQTQKNLGVAG